MPWAVFLDGSKMNEVRRIGKVVPELVVQGSDDLASVGLQQPEMPSARPMWPEQRYRLTGLYIDIGYVNAGQHKKVRVWAYSLYSREFAEAEWQLFLDNYGWEYLAREVRRQGGMR